MRDSSTNIRPVSTRRRLATVIAVIGILVVGRQLMARWPRSVEVVYRVDPGTAQLHVDYLQDGSAVASARFTQPDENATVFRHVLELAPGRYQVSITSYRAEGPATEDAKELSVPGEEVTRFDLRVSPKQPE